MSKQRVWKYILLALLLGLGGLYALPSLLGESPAIQISAPEGHSLDEGQVTQLLDNRGLAYQSIQRQGTDLLVHFKEATTQLNAKEVCQATLGEHYPIELKLVSNTPSWLEKLGARPIKLGLDLRGGVHFLMAVDLQAALNHRIEGAMTDLRTQMRQEKMRYSRLARLDEQRFVMTFSQAEHIVPVLDRLKSIKDEFDIQALDNKLFFQLKSQVVQNANNYTMEQTLTTLRNRVNELGVAEAIVQRQGVQQIVVELPGIQDTRRAKEILGKTATLSFQLYAEEEKDTALDSPAPAGTQWVRDREGKAYLLKKSVILTGDSIVGATVASDDRTGKPVVGVRVAGTGLGLFKKETAANVGKLLGAVYLENNSDSAALTQILISLARIDSPLGSRFQISGLTLQEAQDLSLLLRAGALPAPVSIIEERTVGPSLGQENIRLGLLSIQVGMGLVLAAMLLYYSVLGLIADLALMANVVLLVAILSLMGATLTLPGMAGIVLTVGMAVDANVLIFERIREELRQGVMPKIAIHSGFERALSSIVDANLTTLIVGLVLFMLGTGPVKGFAVTLCVGILTSMVTAIVGTRALVNLLYGQHSSFKLRVGI